MSRLPHPGEALLALILPAQGPHLVVGAEARFSFPALLGMWGAMVLVMMTPLVVPWLRALHRLGPHGGRALMVPSFAVGYALAWGSFSALMAGIQSGFPPLGQHEPLTHAAPLWAGVALVAAGAFQFSQLKNACLRHCRSPIGYFAANWRPGSVGALSMGLRHGLHCLGCCWALMALALVVGMMDPRVMGLLMAVMIGEVMAPAGLRIARIAGAAFVLWGLGLLWPL